jgi:hypothetical protein
MKSKISFWQLLSEYDVVIPMIQRDYAQGRDDPRTKQIRESFLADLRSAFASGRSINLDFVYGSNHSGRLVVLDGQQRLTTLFLLHWYLLALRPQEARHAASRLKRFGYETRTSTRDFCDALIDHLQKGSIWSDTQDVSEWIEDTDWFPRSWKRDPTIAGMLNMLNAIKAYFPSANTGLIWTCLTSDSDPAVTFQFLDMENFRLTDELYIKMNARGRALSDFENFKAWLQLHVERSHFSLLPSDWTDALDGRWTDLFWRHRAPDTEEIDDLYLNFFNSHALCTFAESRKIVQGKLDEPDVRTIQALNDNRYVGATDRERLGAYHEPSLNRCFAVLEALCHPGENPTAHLAWFMHPRNYGERVLAHTVAVFLECRDGHGTVRSLQSFEFAQWQRVVNNLVRNTTIDSPITFVRAVKAVSALGDRLLSAGEIGASLYSRVAGLDPSKSDFFDGNQWAEEVRKCQLIRHDPQWEASLIKAERHPYFFYQTGFLVEFSVTQETPSQERFERYLRLTSLLFGEGILKHPEYLLQRALLCYGDYTVWVGSNLNLCRASASSLRDRNENWRRVFHDKTRRMLLQQLCDDLLQQLAEMTPTMDALIDMLRATIHDKAGSPQSGDTGDNWRWLLVKGPSLLDECAYLQLRRRADTEGSEYVSTYLLAGLRMSGSYAELHTYDLWINHLHTQHAQRKLHPFTLGKYQWNSGKSGRPHILLHGWRYAQTEIALRIDNHGGQFAIRLLPKEDGVPLPAGLCETLEAKLAFSPAADESGVSLLLVPIAEIEQRLADIIVAVEPLVAAA